MVYFAITIVLAPSMILKFVKLLSDVSSEQTDKQKDKQDTST